MLPDVSVLYIFAARLYHLGWFVHNDPIVKANSSDRRLAVRISPSTLEASIPCLTTYSRLSDRNESSSPSNMTSIFGLPSLEGIFAGGINALAVLGALFSSAVTCRFAVFVWTHFIHTSTIGRYKTTASGRPAWAIVTGASDGVGQGFAEALAATGFNVILHGRNEQKLRALIEKLQPRFPACKFDVLILDGQTGVRDVQKMEAAVESLKDCEIKVLINNLGGHGRSGDWLALAQEQSAETVDAWYAVLLILQSPNLLNMRADHSLILIGSISPPAFQLSSLARCCLN